MGGRFTGGIMASGYSWPFKGDIILTSPYGYRDAGIGSGSFHQGVDIVDSSGSGTGIYCIHAGIVTLSQDVVPGWEEAGSMIIVKGYDQKFVTYEEFKPGTMKVKKGDTVKAGQLLATNGISGNATGEHLHLGINDTGLAPLDPKLWEDPAPYLGIKNVPNRYKKPSDIGSAGNENQGEDGAGSSTGVTKGISVFMNVIHRYN